MTKQIPEEIEHKQNTYQTQTEHNIIQKPNTEFKQTEHDQNTKSNTNYLQSINKVTTNKTQTKHRIEHKSRFLELVGVQKSLMIAIYESCKKKGERVTDPLTLEELSNRFQIKISSIKTSACRLEKKAFIIRVQFKNGRGGWTIYEIPEYIYQEIYQFESAGKLNTNLTQMDYKLNTELDTPKSHYNNSNKITIIGDGWDEIDFSALETIGFRKNHLLQLKTANSPEIVQESINHFSFALQSNKKVQGYETPLNVLMTVLKRGEGWVEPNYVSPRERAIQRHIEAKKAEQARAEKAAKELFDLEFRAWESSLTEEERKKIASDRIPSAAIVKLQAHFKETKWPAIRKAWN